MFFTASLIQLEGGIKLLLTHFLRRNTGLFLPLSTFTRCQFFRARWRRRRDMDDVGLLIGEEEDSLAALIGNKSKNCFVALPRHFLRFCQGDDGVEMDLRGDSTLCDVFAS